mmetsp:Transcript_114563/g.330983  ORF Transcript_114563/g.330983 Transcript_114563/m.330983 type:complete len:423 (+) Transcript_114563:215-1483(+)
MDHPSHGSRRMRCNALPFRIPRRVTARLVRMKTNPYVGCFRHSPPTSFRSMHAGKKKHEYYATPQETMRTSPYIGWFRHSPSQFPSSPYSPGDDLLWFAEAEYQTTLALLQAGGPKTTSFEGREGMSRPELVRRINGRLRGGGSRPKLSASKQEKNLISKIGTWLLQPLAQDAESLYQACYTDRKLMLLTEQILVDERNEHDLEEEDESSVALSDVPSPKRLGANRMDVSLSEIAEAYYAHQEIDHGALSGAAVDRLDYVITQADIARMARNAARHLDVDSILSLPVLTYRTSKEQEKEESRDDFNEENGAWSFVMVPDKVTKSGAMILDSEIHDTICVICLEPFRDGDRLRVMPCHHSFHVGCIDRWLCGSHSHHECFTSGCPTCKKNAAEGDQPNWNNDGSVPSWAFTQLGSHMAQSVGC